MKEYTAEIYYDKKFQLAESPYFDLRTGTLSWVDITEGKFYRKSKTGKPRVNEFHQEIGAAVPTGNPGEYVIAGTDGLYLLNDKGSSMLQDMSAFYESFQRSNDAKADPAGRLWFGSSVTGDHEPCGNLYSYENGNVLLKQPETKISNGMAWSSDKTKFYFSDSAEHAVFVYDYDLSSGVISNRQVLFTVENGVPDGMTIDIEDNLWVAVWGGSRLEHRSGADGSLLGIIHVPAVNVTSCCFAGEEHDGLFITTSGADLNGEYDGCLFKCKPDVKGRKPDCFLISQQGE